MEKKILTEKQQEVLNYIKKQILTVGYPPSTREIGNAVGLKSTSSVHAIILKLEKEGYIKRDAKKPRAIEVIDDNFGVSKDKLVTVPIVGTVAAGQPILASQNIEGYFSIPSDYIASDEYFMLRVKGDSMVNAGINNDDIILVERNSVAKNGEIVVALIDDSATVKTFYKEDKRIRLQPENETMDPIIVSNCIILGKVKGLFRNFK